MILDALKDKFFFITGVANQKSVAFHVATLLKENGANIIFSAQNEKNLKVVQKFFPESHCFLLDVENDEHLASLASEIKKITPHLDGFLHSMAFAHFDIANNKFHQTSKKDFLQACHISSFSLIQITNALIDLLNNNSSIVTISISNTKATSYGYLGPIKAMLETSVCYLAKSLSQYGNIRVNSVAAGPLKTSASAGIPNYVENFLYSEALSLRKKSLETVEVAKTIVFLLSPHSSGINAENIIIDNGMNSNYFDQEIVKNFSKNI